MTKKKVATIATVSIVTIIVVSVLVSRSSPSDEGTSDIKNPNAFVIAGQNDIASLDPAYPMILPVTGK